MALNHTHDQARTSWVDSANAEGTDFPVQNLPHGVFRLRSGELRGGVAIGNQILDVGAALDAGLFDEADRELALLAAAPSLNSLLERGRPAIGQLRRAIFEILAEGGSIADRARATEQTILHSAEEVDLLLPVGIGAFTDFMTSLYHTSYARRARPARELSPQFLHLPVAYNSRASSITPSDVDVVRPWGQFRGEGDAVVFAPTRELDFELEFGGFVGPGNALGTPLSMIEAEERLVGYVLVNDWSARDMQRWEQRLGPFLGKSFATSISPWIVTAEALEPFRCPARPRDPGQPQPLPYLTSTADDQRGAIDVRLTAELRSARMRAAGDEPFRIVDSNLLNCCWTLAQMLTHHASNGCNLSPGDLISSGTASGPEDREAACLLEITSGKAPIDLPGGETRCWLEDGDELTLRGRAEREGFKAIGFGTCRGMIAPALANHPAAN